jgi:adenine-specific DNA-methyltransferase
MVLFLAMTEFARHLRQNATDAERLLWRHLRLNRFSNFRFRRQRPVGPYICDFACLRSRLVIELDGSQHGENAAYDAKRDDFLRANGFRVLRFWNADVLHRTESVLDTIFEALHREEMDGRYD